MAEIVDFDSFLSEAQASDEPQYLLFLFLRVELPEDASDEERQQYEAGQGGELVPVMSVAKSPGELADFSALVYAAEEGGTDWSLVLAGALVGEGELPSATEVEETFARLAETVQAGGDISDLLAFDREGSPVVFT